MYDVFAMPKFQFPKDFLWGSGYAGHQVEGDNYNNQWATIVEQLFPEKSGKACNSWELYETDIALMQELEHQAFRTSVEWCRIEPEPGVFNPEATEHYIRFFAMLKERGIKTFCTLVHFTHPLWFEKLGHFTKMENWKYFEEYLHYIIPKLAPYVDFWNVINEFNLVNTPERIELKLNSVRYHARAYHIIKKYSNAPISSNHALVYYMPYRPFDRMDQIATQYRDMVDHEFFFHAIRTGEIIYPYRDGVYDPDVKDAIDFWAINSYHRQLIDARIASMDHKTYSHNRLTMIDREFYLEEIYPECMIANLSRLHDKPIYITENGLSATDDRFRIVYLATFLSAIHEAIRQGADVRGYLYWSLLDNYEWSSFEPRFGLCHVDFKTFERSVKPSGYFYRDIIRNNGVTPGLIQKYLSELPTLGHSNPAPAPDFISPGFLDL